MLLTQERALQVRMEAHSGSVHSPCGRSAENPGDSNRLLCTCSIGASTAVPVYCNLLLLRLILISYVV